MELRRAESSQPTNDLQEKSTAVDESQKLSMVGKFWILNKFFCPLIIAHLAQGISQQALSRGITSIAKEEMVDTLASYGLSFGLISILVYFCAALKNVGLVLVYSRQDNVRMTALSIGIGSFMALTQLVISVTPAGVWIIRDLHKQNEAVVKISCQAFLYLTAIPLIEAIASYYEGYLISQKLTLYTGLARFVECGVQVALTITLIFTAPHIQPILIPVLAWYGGVTSRMVVVLTVWVLSGRKNLVDEKSEERTAVAIKNALVFWFPLTFSRLTEKASRVIVNLIVARTLSENVSAEAAEKALAVIAAVFPFSKILNTWVFELKQVIAAFGKMHGKSEGIFFMKDLVLFSAFINLYSLLLTVILLLTPGVSYYLLNTVLGLNEELSTLSLVPLRVFSFCKCLTVGSHAFGHGVLILKRKTILLTPAGVLRLAAIVAALYSLPLTSSQSGAIFGMTSFVIGFATETIFVSAAALLIILKPRLVLSCNSWPCVSKEQSEETQSLVPSK